MHACLAVPELLSTIFNHICAIHDDDDEYRETEDQDGDETGNPRAFEVDRNTLAALARTCRAFAEPAHDALWYHQATLGPLVRVMPLDLWRVVEETPGRHSVTFVRGLEATDWGRFDYYARKVRTLGYVWPRTGLGIHMDAMIMLASYRPVHSLLPNLRRFAFSTSSPCHPDTQTALLFAQCLLNSNVVDVDLTLAGTDAGIPVFISDIRRTCPRIEVLKVRWHEYEYTAENEVIDALNELMSSLSYLRKLDLDPTHCDAPLHISALPVLEYLSLGWLCFDSEIVQELQERTSLEVIFPGLRRFTFSATSWEDATAKINLIQNPLTSLVVSILPDFRNRHLDLYPSPLHAIQFNNFMHALTRHPCRTSLVHLSLTEDPWPRDHGGMFTSDPPDLNVLCQLQGIEVLTLRMPFAKVIDNGWLENAAAGWPRLRRLTILNRTETTLEGLAPLVRRCPSLKDISIGTVLKPFDIQRLEPSAGNMHIDMIDFTTVSRIERETLGVSKCLLRMFPRLREVYGGGQADRSTWDDLQEHLDIYADEHPLASV
ncbi:hypothetical protein LshimejAT787_1204540 [Lyophyllum shimeji]|uniref:F-box domain-containing protein n=1 Tax=Lyophyllum shimeji TaxID=47721 RepID=A0A9P3PU93_LYOSH|nr:hypothetical protein LshimejAT787_1204540 [Lyophyllum shimeji]